MLVGRIHAGELYALLATAVALPVSTAATEADASPPKGSRTTSPDLVESRMMRSMNSSGF
jgi:hypothetical protein